MFIGFEVTCCGLELPDPEGSGHTIRLQACEPTPPNPRQARGWKATLHDLGIIPSHGMLVELLLIGIAKGVADDEVFPFADL